MYRLIILIIALTLVGCYNSRDVTLYDRYDMSHRGIINNIWNVHIIVEHVSIRYDQDAAAFILDRNIYHIRPRGRIRITISSYDYIIIRDREGYILYNSY